MSSKSVSSGQNVIHAYPIQHRVFMNGKGRHFCFLCGSACTLQDKPHKAKGKSLSSMQLFDCPAWKHPIISGMNLDAESRIHYKCSETLKEWLGYKEGLEQNPSATLSALGWMKLNKAGINYLHTFGDYIKSIMDGNDEKKLNVTQRPIKNGTSFLINYEAKGGNKFEPSKLETKFRELILSQLRQYNYKSEEEINKLQSTSFYVLVNEPGQPPQPPHQDQHDNIIPNPDVVIGFLLLTKHRSTYLSAMKHSKGEIPDKDGYLFQWLLAFDSEPGDLVIIKGNTVHCGSGNNYGSNEARVVLFIELTPKSGEFKRPIITSDSEEVDEQNLEHTNAASRISGAALNSLRVRSTRTSETKT
jgi:hypothetical protein